MGNPLTGRGRPVSRDRPGVSILSPGHDVADARLHREVAALRRAGLEVEVLGLGDPAGAPSGVPVRTWARGGMAARAVRALVLPWRARGRVLLTLDPDVVPSALLAARLRRRHLVADVHEDYVALLLDRPWAARAVRPLQRLAAWCVALAGRATLTVVADDHVPPRADGCRRRLVVRNLPDPALLPDPEPVPDDPPLRAVYIGDVRTSRGLRDMIAAVAAAPGWRLDIVGPIAPADEPWLAARLLADDVLEADGALRVHLHGRLPPQQAWGVARGASVGMLLVELTPAFRDAVPTKLYEYLSMHMAVLATPLPRVVPFVTGSGAGAVVGTVDEAAAQLRAWAADPALLARHRRAAAQWSQGALEVGSPWDDLAGQVAQLVRAG